MSASGWSGASLAKTLKLTGENARRVNDIAVAATAVAAAAGASGYRTYREEQGLELNFKVPGTEKKIDLRLIGASLALIPGLVKPNGYTPYTHALGAGLLASYAIEKAENKATSMAKAAIAKAAVAEANTAPSDRKAPGAKGIVIGRLSPEDRREKRLGKRAQRLAKRLATTRAKLAAEQGNGPGVRVAQPQGRRIGADPFIANRTVTPAEYARQYARLGR